MRLVAALVLLSAATPAASQAVDVLPGNRVRVTLPSATLRGVVLSVTSDTLALGTGVLRPIALSEIQRVERSRGHARWGGAAAGLFIGAALGGGAGALADRNSKPDPFAPSGAASGAFLGGLLGAIVGAIVVPERWETVFTRRTSEPSRR